MVNDFMDEVVSRGAEALLPQNLSVDWLDELYAAAIDFLRNVSGETEGARGQEDLFEDEASMLMLSAVVEILHHQAGYPSDLRLQEGALFEPLSCYALWTVLEYIRRKSQLEIDPPTLENIFDKERIIRFERRNPDVTTALHMLVGKEAPPGDA